MGTPPPHQQRRCIFTSDTALRFGQSGRSYSALPTRTHTASKRTHSAAATRAEKGLALAVSGVSAQERAEQNQEEAAMAWKDDAHTAEQKWPHHCTRLRPRATPITTTHYWSLLVVWETGSSPPRRSRCRCGNPTHPVLPALVALPSFIRFSPRAPGGELAAARSRYHPSSHRSATACCWKPKTPCGCHWAL